MTDPLRFGILGTAHIATKVNGAIQAARGAESAAIASRSLDKAIEWAARHGVPRVFGSYQALLDDPEIDAVYIPLPPSMHLEWTIKAAERKKHVLCEKPLARNTAEAIEMADACRQHGVQLMDGVMWVHHERTPEMRRSLDSGVLGKLRRVTAAFSFNWNELPVGNIRLDPALAGGSLGDLGYYCIRAILWAYGELPERGFATARFHNDVDLNLSAMLWHANDQMASFDCGFDIGMRKWFEVAGTEGSLVCDDFTLPWSAEKARYWIHDVWGKRTEGVIANCVQEVRMIERFCELARAASPDQSWPKAAIDTMRVCDALARSARIGQPVDIAQ